jgi:hypothetical protein
MYTIDSVIPSGRPNSPAILAGAPRGSAFARSLGKGKSPAQEGPAIY